MQIGPDKKVCGISDTKPQGDVVRQPTDHDAAAMQ